MEKDNREEKLQIELDELLSLYEYMPDEDKKKMLIDIIRLEDEIDYLTKG
jgi:hypothetical protein